MTTTSMRARMAWLAGAIFAVASCGVPDFKGFGDKGSGGSDAAVGGKDGGKGGSGGLGASGGSGGAVGGTSGTSGSGGQGTDSGTPCTSNAECSGTKPLCDLASGKCGACLPSDDQCPAGQYCAPSLICVIGCKTDADCNPGGVGPLTCSAAHHCQGCSLDEQCEPGSICDLSSTQCVPGCTPVHACVNGYDCCSGTCALLSADVAHCGTCDNACPVNPANATPKCVGGNCGLDCTFGKADCNKQLGDGCEIDAQNDPQNCGTCGKVCGAGQTCVNFTCT